jgi:hypothetical protein
VLDLLTEHQHQDRCCALARVPAAKFERATPGCMATVDMPLSL